MCGVISGTLAPSVAPTTDHFRLIWGRGPSCVHHEREPGSAEGRDNFITLLLQQAAPRHRLGHSHNNPVKQYFHYREKQKEEPMKPGDESFGPVQSVNSGQWSCVQGPRVLSCCGFCPLRRNELFPNPHHVSTVVTFRLLSMCQALRLTVLYTPC